jgi:hypothetical protein
MQQMDIAAHELSDIRSHKRAYSYAEMAWKIRIANTKPMPR